MILTSSIKQFKYYKQLADKAMDQLTDEAQIFHQIHVEDNSIAIIMHHLSGNMKSRWTNIFDEDGEKPWRNRDKEFDVIQDTPENLRQMWEEGWNVLFSTLQSLSDADIDKVIYIRNEGLTISDAILRQLCHYSYHCGQIVSKCKQLAGGKWESLSIPRNNSDMYNQEKFSKEKQTKHFLDTLIVSPEDNKQKS